MNKKRGKHFTENEHQLIISTVVGAIERNEPIGQTIEVLCQTHFPDLTTQQIQQRWCRLRKKYNIAAYSHTGRKGACENTEQRLSANENQMMQIHEGEKKVLKNDEDIYSLSSVLDVDFARQLNEIQYFVESLPNHDTEQGKIQMLEEKISILNGQLRIANEKIEAFKLVTKQIYSTFREKKGKEIESDVTLVKYTVDKHGVFNALSQNINADI